MVFAQNSIWRMQTRLIALDESAHMLGEVTPHTKRVSTASLRYSSSERGTYVAAAAAVPP